METKCGHCQVRPASINTGISEFHDKTTERYRCVVCYGVEQQIASTKDWRDCMITDYAADNGLNLRSGESVKILMNRCKIFMAKRGFLFDNEKTKSA